MKSAVNFFTEQVFPLKYLDEKERKYILNLRKNVKYFYINYMLK